MKRRIALWCSGLLIIIQLLTAPFAYAMQPGTGAVHCGHAGATPMHCPCGGCDGCPPPGGDQSRHGSTRGSGVHHDHGRCAIACAHAPMLGMHLSFSATPPRAVAVPVEPKGPAFRTPLFAVLRPPN